jgi:hypothetical protein
MGDFLYFTLDDLAFGADAISFGPEFDTAWANKGLLLGVY